MFGNPLIEAMPQLDKFISLRCVGRSKLKTLEPLQALFAKQIAKGIDNSMFPKDLMNSASDAATHPYEKRSMANEFTQITNILIGSMRRRQKSAPHEFGQYLGVHLIILELGGCN